jgi:hypothetical protein
MQRANHMNLSVRFEILFWELFVRALQKSQALRRFFSKHYKNIEELPALLKWLSVSALCSVSLAFFVSFVFKTLR